MIERSEQQPRVLVVITRAEPGGAQGHVLELLRGLGGQFEFALAVGEEESLTRDARALGIDVRVIPSLCRSVDLRADVRTVRALTALIREFRPALVHTHSTKAGVLGRIAARRCRVPVLHTAHAWSFSDGLPWSRVAMAVPVEAVVGRLTDQFIVVSAADREIALRYRIAAPEKFQIVHNGVPDVPLRADPGASMPPVVTMVARMAEPKDYTLLLRAAARSTASFRVRLVGDGPHRPALEKLAEELGLTARVEWVGTSARVAELLSESSVCALISKQEGFPLVVLEAMRAGLPVIASDVGGIREAITDEQEGILVPRGEQGALTAALDRLAASPALRAKMGAAGRARFEQQFTAEHMLAGTSAVYRQVLDAPAAP